MDDDLDTIEEAFASIPPEVQDYIYSNEFNEKFNAFLNENISDAEKQNLFKGALFGFLAQIENEESLAKTIDSLTSDEPTKQKIKQWVETNVSEKLLPLITEAYIEDDNDEDTGENSGTTTPVASSSLASLSDRLKQASIATPMKRGAGNVPTTTKPSSSEAMEGEAKPSTDPYHETIGE